MTRKPNVQHRYEPRSGTSPKQKDQKMLTQLTVCTVLFLTILIGRSLFPGKIIQIRETMLNTITSDTDFRGALTSLGASISGEYAVFGELGNFYSDVFGPAPLKISEIPDDLPQQILPVSIDSTDSTPEIPIKAIEPVPDKSLVPIKQSDSAQTSVLLSEAASTVPVAGTVLLKADYNGPQLPKRDTMDQISLGAIETMTPVMGRQTSKYGWRTHPITGKKHFHGGADISGKMGTPIKAFADGTVDYIGRDKSYGLYIQLDHGSGVKSFYAHCSKLCAEKGQKVKIGEKIAEIGSTGCSTGPHLHLEIKCGSKRLNPAYYIQFTNS